LIQVRVRNPRHTHANRAATRRAADDRAEQIGQFMGIALELIDIRGVLVDQIDRQREGARRINVIVAEYGIVLRTRLEHVRLQRDFHGDSPFFDGDGLFAFHGLDSSAGD
jgi:hypothetical protein